MRAKSNKPKTLQQAIRYFSDEQVCINTVAAMRWPDGPVCPKCGHGEHYYLATQKRWKCKKCYKQFSVKVGTIFEDSAISLDKWLTALWMLVNCKNGVSSYEIGRNLGITQKSAWFVLQRLREACGQDKTMLKGIVEVDEVYLGGLEQNKHMRERLRYKTTGKAEKTPVIGMRERGGRTKAVVAETVSSMSLENAIRNNVAPDAELHTDEFIGYHRVGKSYRHEHINHNQGEYSRKGVTTNGIESVFAVLKRGLHGVYHHASKKHMTKYIDEFTFRLNEGNVKRHTWDRLDSFVSAVAGKRLTYERLTK
jgi:transposase-like protein